MSEDRTLNEKVGKAIVDYLKSKGITDFENYAIQLTAEHKNEIQELGSFTFKDVAGIAPVQTEEDPTSPEGMFTKATGLPEEIDTSVHSRVIDEFRYGDADEYGELDWFDKIVLDDLKVKGIDTSKLSKVDLRKMTTVDRMGAEEETPTQLVETKAAIAAYERAIKARELKQSTSSLSEGLHHLQHSDLSDTDEGFKDVLTQLKEAVKKLEQL